MELNKYESIIIEDLNLSIRTYNTLKRARINTFIELIEAYKNGTLPKVRNLGQRGCVEVITAIEKVTNGELVVEEEDSGYIAPKELEVIPLRKLNLSNHSYNVLIENGCNTVGKFVRLTKVDVVNMSGLGAGCISEILDTICLIKERGYGYFEGEIGGQGEQYDWGINGLIFSEDIENKSVSELKIHARVYRGFISQGIDTIGKLLNISKSEIKQVPGLGEKGLSELKEELCKLKEIGSDYFIEIDKKELPVEEENKRAIDVQTVNKLKDEYGFKTVWLTQWYGITRSRIQQILSANKKRGNWLNRQIAESEISLLQNMIEQRLDYLSDDVTQAYLMNNMNNDCVVVFVNDEEIKCFFLNMLPEEIQAKIKAYNLDRFTFEELEVIASGRVETILKKEYFFPSDREIFRKLAFARNMSSKDYCKFLTGMEHGTGHTTVTDEKLIDFLSSHYINGELMIPLNNSTMWFRSYADRHGYTIEELAELFGFGKKEKREEWVFGTIAEDMQPHNTDSDDWLDKIYSKYPLLGNCILSEEQQDEIYTNAKDCIDKRLKDYQVKLTLREKMQITLAVITIAKGWDTEETSFWNYITAQFGYRDETNQLRGILCDYVLDATRKNNRLFIASSTDYQYKATILAHALTTKKSWFLLYDFLFDFYKTNMDWTYIEDDPIVARMVIALRNKLLAVESSADDEKINISTKVYYFQEGISKLIINRTGYSIKLINHMLRRLDETINHRELPAEQYVDVLFDQWMANKLSGAKEEQKREVRSNSREVAIDYTRIRPVYLLQNETDIVISFPDIRLKKSDYENITLKVMVSDSIIETRSLSFYGNELGKTLNGFDIDMNMCLRRGNGSLNVRVILNCDEETIYDSEDNLYRETLCFSRSKECFIRDCTRGAYSIFTNKSNFLTFEGTEISEIESESEWNAYFVRLGKGFVINLNQRIMAFDNEDNSSGSGIKVISPYSDSDITYVKNGRRYNVVTHDAYFLLILNNADDLKKYSVLMNSSRIDLSSSIYETTDSGIIYRIPVRASYDKICDFQVIDLEKDRIVSNCSIKVISGFSYTFNRDFYFIDDDFEDAYVRVLDSHGMKEYDLKHCDEIISLPCYDGNIEIKVPRIVIRDNTGELWDRAYTSWIKAVKQDEKIYVSVPEKCSCKLKLGSLDLTEETKGCFDYGNAAFACAGSHETDWISLSIIVLNDDIKHRYSIGRITLNERFVGQVQFDYRDNKLFWNRGLGFVGNSNSKIKLKFFSADELFEFPVDLENEEIISECSLPHSEYEYRIVKESENIFLGGEVTINEGVLFIGDKDELRFTNSMIHIINITNEDGDSLRRIPIDNTYIDQISFEGVQFVDSEDRECPVYKGVLFYLGTGGKHYEYSFERRKTENGNQKYKLNPVRIVYINEHTLSITDEDCDGIYYYKYYDRKVTYTNVYHITDREPDINSKELYSVADLYTYRKERIN